MKLTSTFRLALFVLCCAATFSGCKKNAGTADSPKEPGITGRPSDPPVAIAPTWTPGKRYIMRMESVQRMQFPNIFGGRGGGTNNPPMENIFAQEYSLTVTNAAEGNRGIEMEILAIELEAGRGDQQQINYDSQNKVARDGGPMGEAFDKMIGGKIRFLVSPGSKVLKVEGITELFERIESPTDPAGANTGGRRGQAARGASGILRGAYNEDVFKQMIELSGAPPEAVRIGDSWNYTREVSAPMIGKMTITTTNTLRGWQEHNSNKCARVEFSGDVTSSGEGGTLPFGGRLAVQNGTISGRYWYAPELGLAIETAFDQNYIISISGIPARNPKTPNADTNEVQNLTAPVRQTVSVKLLEIKPIENL